MRTPSLAIQIFAGLVLGIIAGATFYGNPAVQAWLQPVGDIFIHLIKMIVVPIVLSTLIVGVASAGGVKKVGSLGVKTLVYFEIVTTVAILFGVLIANIVHPGTGIDAHLLPHADISKYVATEQTVTSHSFVDTLVNVVPTNIFDSLAKGDMLAVIFFAVFFGIGLAVLGDAGKPLVNLFQIVSTTMFWVTNQIMKVAPLGVFALIGVTVSKFGVASLLPLGKLVITVYVAMALFVLIVFGIIASLVRVNLFSILGKVREEILLAYSTASSETVIARIMQKMENFGCPKVITSFVIPAGYSFNLDGSTLYQSIAALFLAQLYGIHMGFADQLKVVLVLAITSKGIAGVPGVSLVVLLATLGSVGIPLEGVAFIAGIDRILDMARTAVNVCGNSLAAVVVSRWEGQFAPAVAAAPVPVVGEAN